MIDDLMAVRQGVIGLAIAAAVLVSLGTWFRLRHGDDKRVLVRFLTYAGYILFFFSVALFIVAGFGR